MAPSSGSRKGSVNGALKHGRPKGSRKKKDKPSRDFHEIVPSDDGVTTRTKRVWLVRKKLKLCPGGSEALMLRGLKA